MTPAHHVPAPSSVVASPLRRCLSRILLLVSARQAPVVALACVVLAAALLFAGLVRLFKGPHVFGDELFYSDAATSLAQGHGLHVRGESYGFGPLYPALLALVRLVATDQPSAYSWWLTVNAIAVALTAVPAYFIARRLLAPWWSVCVAALAAGVPSAFYAGAVMTDCLGYLAAVTAVLAIVLAVERPTATRQVAVLAAVVVATSVRTQFAVLYASFLFAVGVRWLVDGRLRPRRPPMRQWWPTFAAIAGFGLLVAGTLAAGRSAASLLGGYSDLARGYPIVASVRWAVEHVFDLALYLGLLGGAAAPLAWASLYKAARSGSARHAAFLATTVSATVTGLAVVATFSASPYGLARLHDRYLFYVIPLWLVVLCTWVAGGAPRSRRFAVLSGIAFVLFVLVMPYGSLIVPDGARMFDGTGTAVWANLQDWFATTYGVSGRWALAGAAVLAAVWTVVVPRRFAWTMVAVVAVSFGAGGAIMWKRSIDDSNKGVFRGERAAIKGWVDAAVPGGAEVTLLTVGAARCSSSLWRHSFLFTEFFNGRIEEVPYVGEPLDVGPPTHQLRVTPGGELVGIDATPLASTYIVAPHGVAIVGRQLATGTRAPLVLWQTPGTVRLARARSDADLLREACR